MFQSLKFPLLYVLEALLLPLQAGGFFATYSFFSAKPLASLNLHGKALPAGWKAAVPNHGGYYEWYVIADHPALFTLGILFMFASTAVIFQVRKAQALQRQEAADSSNTAHAIARAFVFATFIFTAYWFVFHLAAIVKPA